MTQAVLYPVFRRGIKYLHEGTNLCVETNNSGLELILRPSLSPSVFLMVTVYTID